MRNRLRALAGGLAGPSQSGVTGVSQLV